MLPIPNDLVPSEKNKLASYLPVRYKGNDFEWDIITGMVLGHALKKEVKGYDVNLFREECKSQFLNCLDQPPFWDVLDRMYFASGAVFDISPLFLLFKTHREGRGKPSASNIRMGELFYGLLGSARPIPEVKDKLNFIEQQMLDVLQRKLTDAGDEDVVERPYLPYLAKAFQDDMGFLASHPKYLLQELTNTLRLYAFGYCSQMALNVARWAEGEPVSRPLYFILDTEKASSERSKIRLAGYKSYATYSPNLFPLLSALEVLQLKHEKRPLWQIFEESASYSEQGELLAVLNGYIAAFADSRELAAPVASTAVKVAFTQLINLAKEQFGEKNPTRHEINERYTKALEKEICAHFIQIRGRAGRVLVLNQDQLLLLTNLSIGLSEKLRLQELMSEFQRRGFYLDEQSQQVLVNFYERMGNVERMSDSGDAVYVRKTV